MFKKLLIAGALSTSLIYTSASSFEFPEKFPYGEVSANVGFYSQYVWRGEQQNAGQSAIQGGLDYGVTLLDTYVDFYVGIWGSNVSGGTNSLSGNELDYYGGLTGAVPFIEDYLSWDAGILYYDYPGMTDETSPTPDFVEYYGSLSTSVPLGITDLGLSYYYGYSPTGFAGAYDYDYQNVGMELPIPSTPFVIGGTLGFTGVDTEGGNQYSDYSAYIGTSAFSVDWGLTFTTVSGYGADVDSDQIIFSVSRSF